MNAGARRSTFGFRNWGLPLRTAVLLFAVLLLYAIVAPVAWYLGGRSGLSAAAAAAGVCSLGAFPALWVSRLLRDPKTVLYGWLLGMFLRMGIPMTFALIVTFGGGVLADSGVMYYLIVFFLGILGVETVLSLPPGERPPGLSDK